MPDTYRELLHAWKNADNAAKLADSLLSAKFDAYLAQSGPMPTQEEQAAVQNLRREATQKLAAAVSHLKTASARRAS